MPLKKYWWVALVLLLAFLWLRASRNEKAPKAEMRELEAKDKAITEIVDALKKSMATTDRLIDLHETNTAVWISLINTNHATIDADKKKTDEKINRVRQYSADDIKRYFSGLDDVPSK